MENKETEIKEQSSKTHNFSWVAVLILLIVILAGAGYWAIPRYFPHLLKPKESMQSQTVVQEQPSPLIPELKQDIADLKEELTHVKEHIHAFEHKPHPESTTDVPLLLAFMDLKMAVRLGLPYQKELNRFKQLKSQDTSPLDEYVTMGIPTLPSLITQLKACIEALPNATSQQSSNTLWGQVKDTLLSFIKINKIDKEGAEPKDIWGLQPLLLLAKQGDIASALTQLKQKPLPKNKDLETWMIHAEAYVQVEKKLDDLMQTSFGHVQK